MAQQWWKWLLGAAGLVLIVASFLTGNPMNNENQAYRIVYYHVPQAWVCVIAFGVSAFFGFRYLKTKDLRHDDRSVAAAGLGFVSCALATLSGAIFAKEIWGSYWNWDPRQTSIMIVLLIYGAYFALRGAMETEDRRARLSAVYGIFSFLTVPFLIFVAPRLVPSLHPSDTVIDEEGKPGMSPQVAMIFFSSMALFTILFFWLWAMVARHRTLNRAEAERATVRHSASTQTSEAV